MEPKKKGIGLVIQIGGPKKKEEALPKDALTQAAEDLIGSVRDDDVEGVKSALEAAFLYLDSQGAEDKE